MRPTECTPFGIYNTADGNHAGRSNLCILFVTWYFSSRIFSTRSSPLLGPFSSNNSQLKWLPPDHTSVLKEYFFYWPLLFLVTPMFSLMSLKVKSLFTSSRGWQHTPHCNFLVREPHLTQVTCPVIHEASGFPAHLSPNKSLVMVFFNNYFFVCIQYNTLFVA